MPDGFIPQGDEFQVSTFTFSQQITPSITALADGGFVVTWMSLIQDANGAGIYGQRYDADGATIGDEFQVNTHTLSDQQDPSITALANGGFVVTWESFAQDGSVLGIYGQRYGANGTTAGDEFQVNTVATNNQQDPDVTALADGGFVVTWMSSGQDGSDHGIFAQRYGADGTTTGPEFQVNTETADAQRFAAITGLADGGFVVTWESQNQDSSGYGIYAQRYGADGVAIGGEILVNTETFNNQQAPSITALTGGGFVVTWESLFQDGNFEGIYAQRYGADGVAAGDEFLVNSETFNIQRNPSISGLADGGFVVTWESNGQDGSTYGVYGQRYDAAVVIVGDEFQVNTFTANDQADPAVTVLADGRFVVTWASNEQDGSGNGIYAQQFAAQLFGTASDDEISDAIGANWINGLAGDDILSGKKGADNIFGGKGKDVLNGGKAGDTLKGGKGADTLNGGKGNDDLYGGKGKDVFVFAADNGSDKIFDFKNGKDKLDLSAFGFANKTEAKSHFFEKGSASNDVVGFKFDGTTIRIEGLDLGDITGADIII